MNNRTGSSLKHYFIFDNHKYSFEYNLFKENSNYFEKNLFLKNLKDINIINEYESNSIITLTEDSINNFIFYCQNQVYKITRENVISLNYLSKKYEVQSLIDETNEYISHYLNDILFQFLLQISNQHSIDDQRVEKQILKNLNKYLNDPLLLLIPVPFMYRIIENYHNKNDSDLIQFMFNYLEKQGRKSSVLFSLIDLKNDQIDVLYRLNTEYSNIFDFSFINSSIVENTFLFEKEKVNKTINLIKSEINKNINHTNFLMIFIIIAFLLFICTLFPITYKQFILPINENSTKIINMLNETINEVNDLKEKLNQKDQFVLKQMKKIDELKEKLNQTDQFILKQMKEIDELKQTKINCPYNGISNPTGIIGFLQDFVNLSAGGKHNPNNPLKNIKNYDNSYFYNYFGNYLTTSENDSWIEFDFGQHFKVDILSYTIRTNAEGAFQFYHSRSWKIVGSNDKINWFKLDKRKDDQNLNGALKQHHFVSKNLQYGNIINRYRYIRYIQKDSWCNGASIPVNPFNIYLTYFEFYGDVYIIK